MATERIQMQAIRSAEVLSGSSADLGVAQHFDSQNSPKLPKSEQIGFGEIALNIAKGYETISVKNSNNEIIYLPFNVADKILKHEQSLIDLKNEIIRDASILSSYTDSRIAELSGYTDEKLEEFEGRLGEYESQFEAFKIEISGTVKTSIDDAKKELSGAIESLSAGSSTQFQEIKKSLSEDESVLSHFASQLRYELGFNDGIQYEPKSPELIGLNVTEAIDAVADEAKAGTSTKQYVDEKIEEITETTDTKLSAMTEYILSHERPVESAITSSSTNAVSSSAIYSALTELHTSLSGDITNLSSDTDNKISAATEYILTERPKIIVDDTVTSASTNPVASQGIYGAISSAVTESYNILDNKISACTKTSDDLSGYLVDDERVYANFAAIINYSLGFNENAQYVPKTSELVGLTVSEAIDYVSDSVTDKIDEGLKSGSTEIYKTVSMEIDALSSSTLSSITYQNQFLSAQLQTFSDYLYSEESMHFTRNVTYEKLVSLVATKTLRPGVLYKIMNYQATINPSLYSVTTRLPVRDSTEKTNHGFYILVKATSNCTLDENARVIIADESVYFEDCALASWEIKYSLANNTQRFAWANPVGFGVIYYMKDDYGNEAPYDFKNILIKRNGVSYYTFNGEQYSDIDTSMIGMSNGNCIKPYFNSMKIQELNNIVIISDNAVGNDFAPGCNNILMTGNQVGNKVSSGMNNSTIESSTNILYGYKLNE